MELKSKYIQKLIVKYFDGTISEKESRELSSAIKKDKDVFRVFSEYKETFLLKSTYSKEAGESWSKFEKVLTNKKVESRKISINLNIIYRVASVFIGLIAIAFIWKLSDMGSSEKVAVQYYESTTPRGQKSLILLPDSSRVWLNSESTLKYNSNYNITNRDLELEGEAFFEVAEHKKNTFRVITQDYITIATGTEFNVMAYREFGRTETTLVDGTVLITTKSQTGKNKNICTLWPGQKVEFNHSTSKFDKKNTEVIYDIAWRNEQFIFKEIPFEELIIRLGRWYNVTIEINSGDFEHLMYSGKFKNKESIWQVLDIIKTTTPFEYSIDNRKVNIKPV